jgi:hypothetical protein
VPRFDPVAVMQASGSGVTNSILVPAMIGMLVNARRSEVDLTLFKRCSGSQSISKPSCGIRSGACPAALHQAYGMTELAGRDVPVAAVSRDRRTGRGRLRAAGRAAFTVEIRIATTGS